jgi:hypothetical protein
MLVDIEIDRIDLWGRVYAINIGCTKNLIQTRPTHKLITDRVSFG